jgi:hypothetical protein
MRHHDGYQPKCDQPADLSQLKPPRGDSAVAEAHGFSQGRSARERFHQFVAKWGQVLFECGEVYFANGEILTPDEFHARYTSRDTPDEAK